MDRRSHCGKAEEQERSDQGEPPDPCAPGKPRGGHDRRGAPQSGAEPPLRKQGAPPGKDKKRAAEHRGKENVAQARLPEAVSGQGREHGPLENGKPLPQQNRPETEDIRHAHSPFRILPHYQGEKNDTSTARPDITSWNDRRIHLPRRSATPSSRRTPRPHRKAPIRRACENSEPPGFFRSLSGFPGRPILRVQCRLQTGGTARFRSDRAPTRRLRDGTVRNDGPHGPPKLPVGEGAQHRPTDGPSPRARRPGAPRPR
jgi:hypothetical protein